MAINFPSSPTPGDIYSYNGYIWEYVSGGYWKSVTESDYIYSATTVGNGTSVISGITGGNLYLKSFSGNNISISESNGTLVFSASSTSTSGNFLPLSGGTVTGNTVFTSGLTATTISATTYYNLPVSGLTSGNNIGVNNSNNNFTISFTGGSVSSSTNFANGLFANTISATTYSNVPVVTGGTYTSGTITFSNATGGTFNVTGLPIGGQGGQLYYFNTSVNQTPYKEFGPTGTTASEQSTTISVANGVTSTIQSYLTPSDYPNSLILPGGVWSFYLHSYKQDSSSSFDLYCDVYKRTSGGVETYLFSTDPFDVTATASTPSMGITDAYFSGTPLTVSDRILVLVRATNTGVSTKQITFVTEGLSHYSYGITTFNGIPPNVSSLSTSDGISGNSTTGAVSIVNTDKGSSQNIFKNIQAGGINQFSAGSNNSNLNFSGINITITSAATNTLVFSASTGGVAQIIGTSGIGVSPSTGVGNVTLSYTGSTGGASLGLVYTTGNNLNFI